MKTEITDYDIEDILDTNGYLSKVEGLNFTPRESQIDMAKHIRNAYVDSKDAIIEAGTGTGKSFAYLSIALLHALKSDEKTIIATSTKILQRQLFDKDIPILLKALNLEDKIKFTLLLGRVNYLCPKRLDYYKNDKEELSFIDKKRSDKFYSWINSTESGILEDFEGILPNNLTRSDICSDGELCTSFKCQYFKSNECFYYKSRTKATQSHLVVTNQHLLLIDSMSRAQCDEDYTTEHYLPPFSRLIIDEAHNTENIATNVFSSSYSSFDVNLVFSKLTTKNATYDNTSLLEYIASFSKSIESAKRVLSLKTTLEVKMNELNDALEEQYTDKDSNRITKDEMSYLTLISIIAKDVIKQLNLIDDELKTIYENLPEDRVDDMGVSTYIKYRNLLSEQALQLSIFIDFEKWDDDVYFYERLREKDKKEKHFLSIAPLTVSSHLYNWLFSKLRTTIFSSATLAVGSSFSFFQKQMGLNYSENAIESKIFQSPFNLESNMLLLKAKDLIPYEGGGGMEKKNEYAKFAAREIERAIEASMGGTLVLFTSNEMLNKVYRLIRDEVKDSFNILIQDHSSNKKTLLEEFKTDEDSVLLGVSSFWEGVDVPGNSLRQVIVVQLPFESPSPIYDARCDLHKQLYGSSFQSLSLPLMIIKLKQGIGRLIRNENDKGVVVILDGKINNKFYTKQVINSLPKCKIDHDLLVKEIPLRIDNMLNA